jgi:trimethylamine corrinoid protein
MAKDDIIKKAFDSIVECDEDMAKEALEEAEAEGISMVDLLADGFSAGIRHLGDLFGRGEIFLPELIFSTEVMKMATEVIESKLDFADTKAKGVMVIGTVEGDVHDIGKGIVASLVKTNGIEVHDLGREVPASVFIEKAIEFNADFVGSSALLTTTMTVQKDIEEGLKAAGIRDKVKTMIGGAPVTHRWAEKIGADAYCEDAGDSVNYVLSCLEKK